MVNEWGTSSVPVDPLHPDVFLSTYYYDRIQATIDGTLQSFRDIDDRIKVAPVPAAAYHKQHSVACVNHSKAFNAVMECMPKSVADLLPTSQLPRKWVQRAKLLTSKLCAQLHWRYTTEVRDRAHYIQATTPKSSTVIQNIPSDHKLKFGNNEFRFLLWDRLNIPLECTKYYSVIQSGQRCTCRDAPLLDRYHLLNCSDTGALIHRHNAAVKSIGKMLIWAGFMNVAEEDNDAIDGYRPDVTYKDQHKRYALDFSMGSLLNKEYTAGAIRSGMAIRRGKAWKVKKWKSVVEKCGYKFVPAIMDTKGGMDDDLLRLIHRCAKSILRPLPRNHPFTCSTWLDYLVQMIAVPALQTMANEAIARLEQALETSNSQTH